MRSPRTAAAGLMRPLGGRGQDYCAVKLTQFLYGNAGPSACSDDVSRHACSTVG